MAIDRIEIENLRGIRQGIVEGFSPLSILVGPNNCGKSTVLEAVYCMGRCTDADDVYELLLRRGGPAHHALQHIFFRGGENGQATATITVGTSDRRKQAILELPNPLNPESIRSAIKDGLKEPIFEAVIDYTFNNDSKARAGHSAVCIDSKGRFGSTMIDGAHLSPWPCSFVDVEAVRGDGALEDAYSRLENNRAVELVIKSLKRAMPTLTDMRILKVDKDFILHTIHGGEKPIPAYLAGDGFKRYLEIASHVVSKDKNGIVLLEEPESFQHPRYLGELAMLLKETASRGTQVILSTHSLELIQLLLAETPEYPSTLFPTVHRLRLHEGVLHAVALNAETARYNMNELEQDLRA